MVRDDGTLTATVPLDIAPGEHRVVLVLDDSSAVVNEVLELPVHDVGEWPGLGLRRADLYGDDGR
jgi:hypothetical protein